MNMRAIDLIEIERIGCNKKYFVLLEILKTIIRFIDCIENKNRLNNCAEIIHIFCYVNRLSQPNKYEIISTVL